MANVWSNGVDTVLIKRIEPEEYCFVTNPREDVNVGCMVCNYKDYSLGDQFGFDSIGDKIKDMILGNESGKDLLELLITYAKEGNIPNVHSKTVEEYSPNESKSFYSGSYPANELNGNDDVLVDDDNYYICCDKESNTTVAQYLLDCMSVKEQLKYLEYTNQYVILPLSVYDHGDITIRTGYKEQFPDSQWDASNVGFIYVSLKKAYENYGGLEGTSDNPTKKDLKRIEHHLDSEVQLYDDYLKGYVYTVQMYDKDEEFEEWNNEWYEDHSLGEWEETNIATQVLGAEYDKYTDYGKVDPKSFDIEEFLIENYPDKYKYEEVEKVVKVKVFRDTAEVKSKKMNELDKDKKTIDHEER